MSDEKPSQATSAALFALILAVTLATTLRHFGPEIDEPHAWRQMDTAHYIRAFAEDARGIDLLRPSVAWMGPYKIAILEFPLHEAVVARVIKALQASPTSVAIPRAVSFAFFLVALAAFYSVARELGGLPLARWATLLYAASPLSLAYSRAVHIDFAVLAFSHASLWLFLRFWNSGRASVLLSATLCATLAALVKAPYLIPMYGALLVFATRDGRTRSPGRRPALLLALTIPVFVSVAWRYYAETANAAAPDWSFIPEYHRMTNMSGWYFGNVAQRLRPASWWTLIGRLARSAAGIGALPVVLGGAVLWVRRRREEPLISLLAALGASSFFYVLVFFNLNVMHDYYQLPLVTFMALTGGLALAAMKVRTATLVTIAAAAVNVTWAERNYYQAIGPTALAGKIVRETTPHNALVITSWDSADPRSPHMLFAAERYGWAVRRRFLNPEIVRRLAQEGATHLAVLRRDGEPTFLIEGAGAPILTTIPCSDHPCELALYVLRTR